MWFFKKKKSDIEKVSERIKKDAPDFGGLFTNINSRKEADILYHKLASKVHPDQFVPLGDENKVKRATELFAELQSIRTDFRKMQEFEKKIETEL